MGNTATADDDSGKGKELVKASDLNLVALDGDNEIAEILDEALAGEKVGMGDLERVKWPTGGGTRFERTILGNTEVTEKITGVIVHQRMSRSYWSDPEPKEGTQPDCTSPDGTWGYGDPGDELRGQNPPRGCEVCPMAQFGSSKKPNSPNSQACKLMRDFFIITPGGVFPLIVSIPPGSLGEGKGYVVDLASHGIRYWTVVTELSLVKATSKQGQAYAQAVLRMVGRLDDPSVEGVREYRERMVPSLATVRVGPDSEPVDDGAEGGE